MGDVYIGNASDAMDLIDQMIDKMIEATGDQNLPFIKEIENGLEVLRDAIGRGIV